MNFEKLNNACKEVNEKWRKMMDENNPFDTISNIAKVIRDSEDKELALAFTNVVGSLLRENGVVVKTSRYEFETDNETDKNKYIIKKEYGVSIDGLDFTKHDKVFEDKIVELENIINHKLGGWDEYGISYKEIFDMKAENQELKKRIAELKNKGTVELPFNALETANMLINAKYKDEIPFLEKQVDRNVYDIDDLEQITEHLLVYCKHSRKEDEQ